MQGSPNLEAPRIPRATPFSSTLRVSGQKCRYDGSSLDNDSKIPQRASFTGNADPQQAVLPSLGICGLQSPPSLFQQNGRMPDGNSTARTECICLFCLNPSIELLGLGHFKVTQSMQLNFPICCYMVKLFQSSRQSFRCRILTEIIGMKKKKKTHHAPMLRL